jgi:DNA-directed RNA polymerase subunit RPC12/RpoP
MTLDEAIKEIKDASDSEVRYGDKEHHYDEVMKRIEAFDLAIRALEQQPKTGHWIEEDMFDGEVAYRCSKCGGLFELENGTPKENEYNFCPKCGEKMESEE